MNTVFSHFDPGAFMMTRKNTVKVAGTSIIVVNVSIMLNEVVSTMAPAQHRINAFVPKVLWAKTVPYPFARRNVHTVIVLYRICAHVNEGGPDMNAPSPFVLKSAIILVFVRPQTHAPV